MSLEAFFENERPLLDKMFFDLTDKNPNLLVPWYFISAYAYYEQDDPVISDAAYDRLIKHLIEKWEIVEHRHKQYIDYDALLSGTFLGEYPPQTEGAVEQLREMLNPR